MVEAIRTYRPSTQELLNDPNLQVLERDSEGNPTKIGTAPKSFTARQEAGKPVVQQYSEVVYTVSGGRVIAVKDYAIRRSDSGKLVKPVTTTKFKGQTIETGESIVQPTKSAQTLQREQAQREAARPTSRAEFMGSLARQQVESQELQRQAQTLQTRQAPPDTSRTLEATKEPLEPTIDYNTFGRPQSVDPVAKKRIEAQERRSQYIPKDSFREKALTSIIGAEKRVSTLRDKTVSALGITPKEIDAPTFIGKAKQYAIETPKAIVRTPIDIAAGLTILPGRIVTAGIGLTSKQSRGVLKETATLVPKQVVKAFDPRNPQGLVNIGLFSLGVKGQATRISLSRPTIAKGKIKTTTLKSGVGKKVNVKGEIQRGTQKAPFEKTVVVSQKGTVQTQAGTVNIGGQVYKIKTVGKTTPSQTGTGQTFLDVKTIARKVVGTKRSKFLTQRQPKLGRKTTIEENLIVSKQGNIIGTVSKPKPQIIGGKITKTKFTEIRSKVPKESLLKSKTGEVGVGRRPDIFGTDFTGTGSIIPTRTPTISRPTTTVSKPSPITKSISRTQPIISPEVSLIQTPPSAFLPIVPLINVKPLRQIQRKAGELERSKPIEGSTDRLLFASKEKIINQDITSSIPKPETGLDFRPQPSTRTDPQVIGSTDTTPGTDSITDSIISPITTTPTISIGGGGGGGLFPPLGLPLPKYIPSLGEGRRARKSQKKQKTKGQYSPTLFAAVGGIKASKGAKKREITGLGIRGI